MSTRRTLDVNITGVEFHTGSYIRLDGMCWSKSMGRKVISEKTNIYTQTWDWARDVPEPVNECLREVSQQATLDLVDKKALPTFWPSGLMEDEQHYPFRLSIEKLYIHNADWGKDTRNIATFRIFSNIHWPGSRIEFSEVPFDIDFSLEQRMFEILYEYM